MIFKQWEQVLSGEKTQTRRLVKEGDYTWMNALTFPPQITEICQPGRTRWALGKTYAVQPGRGKKAVGRIRITKIRRESVGDISLEDVFAEGVGIRVDGKLHPITVLDVAREEFARLWNSIHKKVGERFEDSPKVWALTFEAA